MLPAMHYRQSIRNAAAWPGHTICEEITVASTFIHARASMRQNRDPYQSGQHLVVSIPMIKLHVHPAGDHSPGYRDKRNDGTNRTEKARTRASRTTRALAEKYGAGQREEMQRPNERNGAATLAY